MTSRPRAFRLNENDRDNGRAAHGVVIEDDPFDAIDGVAVSTSATGPKRGGPWFGIFFGSLAVLFSLAFGRSALTTIMDMMAVSPWLGGVAAAAGAAAVIAFVVLMVREISGVVRERTIERMRSDAVDTLGGGDEKAAVDIVTRMVKLYDQRGSSEAHVKVAALTGQIMAAEDRLVFVEREFLAPLDREAKRAVANAARQVSVVTALSPRALIDVVFVVYAVVRLLRQLARIYGGKPGIWGFLRLLKSAFAHLTVTGGIAVGDNLLQQIFGLGVAARISAKLGEGVLNGLMTARFGLAAITVCRPLPFIGLEPPRLGEVAGEIVKKAEAETPSP